MESWSQPPQSFEDILEWITLSNLGAQVVHAFRAAAMDRKIEISTYPEEIRGKLRAIRSKDEPAGAAFVTDGTRGTIYVDLEQALGVTASLLVHELVHCLDQELWKIASERASQERREQVILESERKAFETQYHFTEEMKKRVPGFGEFLSKHYPKARILHEALTREEISKLYGLRAA